MIKVYVIRKGPRHFLMRWKDPLSLRLREKRASGTTRREAEREAGDLETALQGPAAAAIATLADFVDRYETDHVLVATGHGNQAKWNAVISHFYDYLETKKASDQVPLRAIDAETLLGFETYLAGKLKSQASVHSYMATLRAGLSYAADAGWMAPIAKRRKRGRDASTPATMKGRPLCQEDVDRLLASRNGRHLRGKFQKSRKKFCDD